MSRAKSTLSVIGALCCIIRLTIRIYVRRRTDGQNLTPGQEELNYYARVISLKSSDNQPVHSYQGIKRGGLDVINTSKLSLLFSSAATISDRPALSRSAGFIPAQMNPAGPVFIIKVIAQ